jgi:hypothetical protein
MSRVLAILALAGCNDYATHSVKNAPGVIDLGTPLPHENGDPQRFEEAAAPGFETLSIWTNPYWVWGHGRYDANGASREAGLEVHVEHADSGPLDASSFGITAGLGFAQWGSGRTTDAVGAFYAELDHRLPGDQAFITVGLGPALYVQNREAGAQLSLRIPLGLFRVRYMATSGIEVMAGFELPFPFFFSRSK